MNKELINGMLRECCVLDIETSSVDILTGKPINIRTDFDNYIEQAQTKWIGIYSYKFGKYFVYNALTHREEIIKMLNQHNVYIGMNSEKFDIPILKNNNLINKKWFKQIDIQNVLGTNKIRGHKNRASYMGINLKPVEINGKKYGANTLMSMAYHFNLKMLKGDIDYNIFLKNNWNEQEVIEIKKYLKSDVIITKNLFEKIVLFWSIFTDWLYEEDVKRWVWVRSSISSLTYCAACKVKGVKATFSNNKGESEDMGGRAVPPVQDETYGVDYLDEASKYPHIFSEFNLFNEININTITEKELSDGLKNGTIWHGNEMFKVKGYYNIKEQGVLEADLINKLKTRWDIKKILAGYKETKNRNIEVPTTLKTIIPNNILTDNVLQALNGLQYAIKIFANSLYGAVRSELFEQIHTPNAGYDCCWIGQQIHEYVQKFFEDRGFKLVGGFTDSWFLEHKKEYDKDSIKKLCSQCMSEIQKYMPFPAETHIIDYERYMDYIVYHYDEKKKEYKKNNYAFISEGKVKIVGFPIMKNNATKLSIYIFKKYLEKEGIKKNRLKFEREYVEELIKLELNKDITLAAINFKCNPANTYKKAGQIQAQISATYLDGLDGNIDLIKNTKYGKIGKGYKYCTPEEAKQHNIQFSDLELTKVWNELAPFIIKEKEKSLEDWGL